LVGASDESSDLSSSANKLAFKHGRHGGLVPSSSSAPLAGRGGEGGSDSAEAEAGVGRRREVGGFLPLGRNLWRRPLFRWPLPTCGRSGAWGPVVSHRRRRRRFEARRRRSRGASLPSKSNTSTASAPFVIRAGKDFRQISNLHSEALSEDGRRILRRLRSKWFVPASVPGGGVTGLALNGGEREGLDGVGLSLRRVFLLLPGTYVYFLNFMGSFVINCTPTVWF